MLDYWLGQCYHASIKGDDAEVLRLFKNRLEADQNLKKQAQQKLSELEQVNRAGMRCFISKKYAEALRSVLT